MLNTSRLCIVLVSLASVSMAQAQTIGIDQNGDFLCDPAEMAIPINSAGETLTVHVVISGMPDILFMACTVCISDKSLISSGQFEYSTPASWLEATVHVGESEDPVGWFPQPEQVAQYPNYRCWHAHSWLEPGISGNEFMTVPGYLGSLSFETAGTGCLEFFFDGINSAYAFDHEELYLFDEPGETCLSEGCNSTATEPTSWGLVKQLFR